ncbi:hypothetical protein L2E82_22028 [Cichorium intybus]|uniref:Uncharacterized protein n=1 Tax=Cichorium intybus TaxID=13427 RepID=A0ACB9DWB9_CICIN|nr:hypothetical protein L2E82_22028 [Cichorium intybus]
MANTGDGWTHVSGRRKRPPEKLGVITMFVSNLPEKVSKGELWKVFGKFGELSDVYIAQKKDANKRNFAFVRFKNNRNQSNIEAALQNISIAGRLLQVNVAKFDRKQQAMKGDFQYRRASETVKIPSDKRWNTRGVRTFASVVAGCDVQPPPPPPASIPVSLFPNPVMTEWIDNELTYMGVAHSMEHLHSLNPGIATGDDDAFSMKYAGGLRVYLRFRSSNDVIAFSRVKDDWFTEFSRANQSQFHFERVTWLKVFGLPSKLWDRDNFNRIAGKFGQILVPFEASFEARDLSQGRICILTESRKRIDEEVLIECEGQLMNISVLEFEDGWFPLSSNGSDVEEERIDSDGCSDNDSDGISDTIMFGDDTDDIEDGEIVGDETVAVEDSFRRETVGDGIPDQAGETRGDGSDSQQPFINCMHGKPGNMLGESHQPGGVSSPEMNSANIKKFDPNESDNVSFGELKKMIPNGCFGPFNHNRVVPPPAGPIGDVCMDQDSVRNISLGGMDTMGPDRDFTGSYTKRRRIRVSDQCDGNIPPPPNFEYPIRAFCFTSISASLSSSSILPEILDLSIKSPLLGQQLSILLSISIRASLSFRSSADSLENSMNLHSRIAFLIAFSLFRSLESRAPYPMKS